MKYMLLICVDPDIVQAHREKPLNLPDIHEWVADLDRRQVRLDGNPLQEPADATTVRVRDGSTLVADGPFAETKEHIAGYDIIDCADLDEAIEIATRHPCAHLGAVEVRPFGTL
jgi:hypothetical protein